MSVHQVDSIKEYYGRVLQGKNDLKTTACCSAESIPTYLRATVSAIHQEVREKFYGCGVPIPPALEGCRVLDLGSGSGRDCYILSRLVGEHGRVLGIDMTEEQLMVARRHQEYHRKEFGYRESNVEFRQGYIEDLAACDIGDETVDLIVSNCVINLSPDKERVFSEAWRVLKPGGELYFSDVFCDRRLPEQMRDDPVLLGECLGGAVYTEDFRRLLAQIGCQDFRVVGKTKIAITNDSVAQQVGNAQFYSITVRAFKLPLEDRCEDYGQVARYLGTLTEMPHQFVLDDHHIFEAGRPMLVCSNTAAMLSQTRFREYFEVVGDKSQHFGLFNCDSTQCEVQSGGSSPCC